MVLLLATLQNHNRWRGWLALLYKATALSHHTALSSRDVPAQALPSGFHLAAPDQMTPPPPPNRSAAENPACGYQGPPKPNG